MSNAFSIEVSDDGHHLLNADGSLFFYLSDTAWPLFRRLDLEETLRYLQDRADKRFTVIQATAVSELDGLTVPKLIYTSSHSERA